jgi:hypothetical protein
MRKHFTPALVLSALCFFFLAYLLTSSAQMPERVATRFGMGGEPVGWMSRTGYVRFLALFGVGFSLLLPGMFFVIRFIPAQFINIPHRNYWLAPERRAETYSYLLRHSFWLACLSIGFVIGLHYLTMEANRQSPVQLPMHLMWLVTGGFLAGTAIWIIPLVRRFRRPKQGDERPLG